MSKELENVNIATKLGLDNGYQLEPYSRELNAAVTVSEIFSEATEIDQEAMAILMDWDVKMPKYSYDERSEIKFSPALWLCNSTMMYDDIRRFTTQATTDIGYFGSNIEGYDPSRCEDSVQPRKYLPPDYERVTLTFTPDGDRERTVFLQTTDNYDKRGREMAIIVGKSSERTNIPTNAARLFKRIVFDAIRSTLEGAAENGPDKTNKALKQ